MPLRFINRPAQIFFWIFFLLFLAAYAGYLGLYFKKSVYRRIGKTTSLACFAASLFCLAPKFPHVFVCYLLIAFGELFYPESKRGIFFCSGAVLLALSHGIAIALMASMQTTPLPGYVYAIFAIFVLLVGVGSYFLHREAPVFPIVENVVSCLPLLALLLAVKLVAEDPISCELILLIGEIYYVGGDLIVSRLSKIFSPNRRELYAAIPELLGQVLTGIGLVLCLTAL